ncbi:MAG: ABC transporter ATP-binding protein [Acidobacteria bacterium]|nr:ABC transporter ATP-binding protein [Acidobacteriota bacterium]
MISWIPSEMRWLFRQVRPFLRWHIASFLCMSVGSFLALLSPLVLKWMIDVVLPGRRVGLLVAAVVLIFLCHQGRAVLTTGGGYLTMLAAQQLALALRMRLLRHLDTLSADYHEGTPVGASMYPLKDPIDEISFLGSDLVPSILRTLLATLLTLGAMLILNPRMTLVVLPLIPVFVFTRKHFRNRLERDSETVQQNQVAWSSFLQEHLSSIIAIQLLRREQRQERTAFCLLGASVRSLTRLFRTGVWFTFFTSLTIGLAMSGVIGYGGWSVLEGTLTVGGLVAFYTYLAQLFEPLSGVAETYARAQKTFASIRRVQSVLALEPAIKTCPTAIKFPENRPWTIQLADVRFGYPKSDGLLCIPRLEIPAGDQVAIVGENGAGKSTLAKLIARLYDVDSGSISVAGQDVREIEIESLREQVCYVPPHPVLFDTTLAGNLRLGKGTASESELKEVMDYVGLATGSSALREGLNRRIGPGGHQLSGGQRQRVGIGRAILQRPRILILDEATSSLDAGSERQLLSSLRRILPGTTIVVVSHRLSALHCVNRVIVLDAGRIVEDDVPAALLANSGAYSRLFTAGAPPCALVAE